MLMFINKKYNLKIQWIIGIGLIFIYPFKLYGNDNDHYSKKEAADNAVQYLRSIYKSDSSPTLGDYFDHEGITGREIETNLATEVCLCQGHSDRECGDIEQEHIINKTEHRSVFLGELRRRYNINPDSITLDTIKILYRNNQVIVGYEITLTAKSGNKIIKFRMIHSYTKLGDPWDGYLYLRYIDDESVYKLSDKWAVDIISRCKNKN